MPVPFQAPIFKKEDLQGDDLGFFNQFIANLVNQINAQAGHAGPIQLANHLDLSNNRIMNVAPPVNPTDAVSQAIADAQFGATALQPHLEALGKKVLQTARRINDKVQRENYSSWLNGILNTAPTTNTSQLSFGPIVAGTVDVTVSAGFHQRVDGSRVAYPSRTDTLSIPTSFVIVSVVRSGNEVICETSAANGFVIDELVTLAGVTDPSFDGSFTIDNIIDATHFSYPQIAPDATSSGGTVALGGVFYYYLKRDTNTLGLTNNVYGTGDSWTNRLNASFDGQTIIAVAALNGSAGADPTNSAAGATNPIVAANVHIFGRL